MAVRVIQLGLRLPISGQQFFFVALFAVAILVYLGGEAAEDVLIYRGDRVQEGQVWRLLTAHWVHSNLNHLLLNSGALALAAVLFANSVSVRTWMSFIATGALFITLCYFVFHDPETDYFGLSALFYGIVVLGALASFSQDRLIAAAALCFVMARLLVAWLHGSSGEMEAFIQAPVAEWSHVYGASWGLLFALVYSACRELLTHGRD